MVEPFFIPKSYAELDMNVFVMMIDENVNHRSKFPSGKSAWVLANFHRKSVIQVVGQQIYPILDTKIKHLFT